MAGQVWVTNSLGGFLSNNEFSRKMRVVSQPSQRFRQFVEMKNAKGRNAGDLLIYTKYGNAQTAGSSLTETSTIPETQFPIVRGTLTITEYGNAIPYTAKLETLSELNVNDSVSVQLRNDMAKVLDSAAATQFTSANYRYVCTTNTTSNFATNGTFSATATGDLNAFHVKRIVRELKVRNIQPYANGSDYIGILGPQAFLGLFNDTSAGGWNDVSKYTDRYASGIFNGEVGKYHMVRFVEETNFLSNAIGASSLYGEAIIVGADAVSEGVAVPEEIRAKVPTDFGRSKALAWYFMGGWQKNWNTTDDSEDRIVYVGSL